MTCKCNAPVTHHAKCPEDASETGLCDACQLCADLNGQCAVPYVVPRQVEPDVSVPITNEQKDAALQNFIAENGF